jgi:hypothetical protein
MTFVFKAAAPADQVTLEIQQPLRATDFATVPPPQSTLDDNGFKYHVSQYSDVAANQTIKVEVKYTKADTNPSAPPTVVPASTVPAAPAASNLSGVVLVIALVIAGAVAVFGIFTWQRRERELALARIGESRAGGKRGARRVRGGSAGAGFCTQCGRSLRADDNYCPKCGAKRR